MKNKMTTELFLLVSPHTFAQINAGCVVEVATDSKKALTSKHALVREVMNSKDYFRVPTLFVDVSYSHNHFGKHFVFLSLPSGPVRASLAEEVNQKGTSC